MSLLEFLCTAVAIIAIVITLVFAFAPGNPWPDDDDGPHSMG